MFRDSESLEDFRVLYSLPTSEPCQGLRVALPRLAAAFGASSTTKTIYANQMI